MNKTKRKILDCSLELFNEFGLPNVSQRRITSVLKISPGNLTYHFKKKEDIYETLYFEFIALVEKSIKKFLKGERNLITFSLLTEEWFDSMYAYRFIFLDITNLMRINQKISLDFQNLVATRQSLFLKIMNELVSSNRIRKEEIPDEFNFLYNRLHIVSDFYLSSLSGFSKKITEEKRSTHKKTFFLELYPYLTKKGKEEYVQIFNKL